MCRMGGGVDWRRRTGVSIGSVDVGCRMGVSNRRVFSRTDASSRTEAEVMGLVRPRWLGAPLWDWVCHVGVGYAATRFWVCHLKSQGHVFFLKDG